NRQFATVLACGARQDELWCVALCGVAALALAGIGEQRAEGRIGRLAVDGPDATTGGHRQCGKNGGNLCRQGGRGFLFAGGLLAALPGGGVILCACFALAGRRSLCRTLSGGLLRAFRLLRGGFLRAGRLVAALVPARLRGLRGFRTFRL